MQMHRVYTNREFKISRILLGEKEVMTFTILDYCRNCHHSVNTHIGDFGRDGEIFGYFKVKVWDRCDWRLSLWHDECGCKKFVPSDNLKYLETLSEQASK